MRSPSWLHRLLWRSDYKLSGALKALLLAVGLVSLHAVGSPRELAQKLHQRIVGAPAKASTLDAMEPLVAQGDFRAAAQEAMSVSSASSLPFYRTTLKIFFSPLSNVEQNPSAPLNDMTATLIGMFRDNVPFDQALSSDMVYAPLENDKANYSRVNNDAFAQIDTSRADLRSPEVLRQFSQSELKTQGSDELPLSEFAGVLTTRAFAEAYYQVGTNRRAIKYLLKNFLCSEMENLHDTSRPDDRVRQDIVRAPAGSPDLYKTSCMGCHSGMDSLAGAFAYLDFRDKKLVEEKARLQKATATLLGSKEREAHKYLRLSKHFPSGFETRNHGWENRWTEGKNQAFLGWRPGRGNIWRGEGPQSLGQALSQTEAFSQCMVKRAFRQLCLRDPTSDEAGWVREAAIRFETFNYNLRNVFADVASYCIP